MSYEKKFKKEIDEIYRNYKNDFEKNKNFNIEQKNNYTSLIARLWNKNDKNFDKKEQIFWLRFDESFLDFFENKFCKNIFLELQKNKNYDFEIILSVDKSNFNQFKNFFENIKDNELRPKNFTLELPAFISQRDLQFYREIIEYFEKFGIKSWIANNLSEIEILPNDKKSIKISGNFLYNWNGYSARFLKEYGFCKFITSWEDDFLNVRRFANSGIAENLIVPIFGFPVLAKSLMLPKNLEYGKIISDKETVFLKQIFKNEAALFLPENPFMIFNFLGKLKKIGVKNFLIDFSFCKFGVGEKSYKNFVNLFDIFDFVENEKNFENTTKFNFKEGIK